MRRAVEANLTAFEEERMPRHVGRDVDALFDEDDRRPLRVDLVNHLSELADDLRSEAEAQLVDQHQLGTRQESATERQHLLLAAGQRPGALGTPTPQHGEATIALSHVGGVEKADTGEPYGFFDRESRKC